MKQVVKSADFKIDRSMGKTKDFVSSYPVDAEKLCTESQFFSATDFRVIPNVGAALIESAASRLSPNEYKAFAEKVGLKSASALKEGYSSYKMRKELLEGVGPFATALKEDLTTTNAGTYTTAIQQVIMADFLRDTEKIMSLVYVNEDMMRTPGSGAYAIPVSDPVQASQLGELGEVIFINTSVRKVVATPKKIAAGQIISWELQTYSVPDLMKWQMRQLTDAITRYVSQYILTTLVAGTTNVVSASAVSYNTIVESMKKIRAAVTTADGTPYNFIPDKIVLSPLGMQNFYEDSTIKNYVYFSAILNKDGTGTNLGRPVISFLDMEVIVSNLLTATVSNKAVEALLVDSKRAGMLIKASDIQVWEGVLPRTAGDRSIIVGMLMDVIVIYGGAIAVITSA